MKTVKIKNIGRVVSGATPSRFIPEYWNGHIPWITPKEIGQLKTPFLTKSVEQITEAGLKSCSATILPKKSIIFSSRAPIGLVAVNEIEVCTNQGFKSIVPNENIDPLYVYYALKINRRKLNDLGTGTTFKELSKTSFENFKIPLPESLAEQQKIAYILSKAEALIQKRKETINGLDEYLKSTFLEMFSSSLFGNRQTRLGKHLKLIGGEAFKSSDFVEFTDPDKVIPVIKIGTINKGYFDKSTLSYVSRELLSKYRNFIEPNNLLITLTGTVGKDDYGNTLIIPDNDVFEYYYLNQRVAKIVADPQIFNNSFLNHLFKYKPFKRELLRSNRGVRQANLSNSDIYNAKIVIPSIELQQYFELINYHIEALKAKQEASLRELEQLYQSLMQRAFKGELVLEKVDIEDVYEEFEHFDGGFVPIEEAQPALDKIREKFESLPAIKSKDEKLIEKIRKLDLDKAQLGRIPFDRDYAIYRVLYHRFEYNQSAPFLTIYDWLLTDFVDLDYNKIKNFIFRELNEENPTFEQIFIFNEDEKKYRTELKLLL